MTHDTAAAFAPSGDKTAFTAAKRLIGYTGATNDPAFAEHINFIFGEIIDLINQHANDYNTNAQPIINGAPALSSQVSRNSFPVFTVFPFFGTVAPANWAICQRHLYKYLKPFW